MKAPRKRFLLITLAMLFLFLCAEGNGLAQSGGGCTASSLKGRWGFLITGHALQGMTPAPYAAGGVLTLKPNGTFTMTGTETINGSVAPLSLSGAYTIGSDCRGSATSNGQPLFNFVVAGNGPQLEIIRTDLGFIVTGTAKRMAEKCGLASVRGTYGYAFNAIVFNITVQNMFFPVAFFAGGGTVAVSVGPNGGGKAVLDDTASFGGLVIPRHYEGTVTVNPDCTGSAVVTLPPNAPTNANPVHIDAFWVDNRESVLLIQTDPNTFIAGEATQLRRIPRP